MTQSSQTSTNNITLSELVVVLPDNHMICLIDSPKIEEIGNLVHDALCRFVEKQEKLLVQINSISGKFYFWNCMVLGFYFRPATKSANEEFQKKILEIAERQAVAGEKVAGDCSHGEDWKA